MYPFQVEQAANDAVAAAYCQQLVLEEASMSSTTYAVLQSERDLAAKQKVRRGVTAAGVLSRRCPGAVHAIGVRVAAGAPSLKRWPFAAGCDWL